MISMTGYSSAESVANGAEIRCDIKSLNSRFFECSIILPDELKYFEKDIKKIVSSSFNRGNIEVTFKIIKKKDSSTLVLDKELLNEYKDIFSKIEKITGTKAELKDYLSLEGIIKTEDEDYKDLVFSSLTSALDTLKKEKEREGEGTKKNIEKLLSSLKDGFKEIKDNQKKMEDNFKRILLSKYKELSIEDKNNDSLFIQEVASLLVKYSINEEVERIDVHLKEFDRLLDLPICGKKLDFLSQEINREVNTICSKSQLVDITHASLKMKDSLENIREQLRNVE